MTYDPTRWCAARRDCRAWDPVGGPDGAGAGAEATGALCDACVDYSTQAVQALPFDWHDLEQQLPPALGVWGEGQPSAAGDAEAPIPMNLGVEAMQAAIWRLATTWEEVARDVALLPDPPHRRTAPTRQLWIATASGLIRGRQSLRVEHPSMAQVRMRPGPSDVVRACRVLAPRLALLADLPAQQLADYPLAQLVGPVDRGDKEPHPRWDTAIRKGSVTIATVEGWRGVLDLAQLHQRARGMLGLTSPVRRLPGNCPACDWPQLVQEAPRRREDEPLVKCTGCGLTMAYDAWQREARGWMKASKRSA